MMLELEENDETDQDQEKSNGSNREKKTLTNRQIIAQALLFMIAGSDTTGTALTYTSYFLALNTEYQDKLIQEIDTVLEKHVMLINL